MIDSTKADWIEPIEEFQKTRRRLPHMETKWATYFCTSNTKNRKALAPEDRDILFSAIKFLDGKKYDLDAAVVMPDHFHLLIRPLAKGEGIFSLSEIFHSIKSFTSHKIDRGVIFQSEHYDHLIRNEADNSEKFQYIVNNPIVAGLVDRPEDYRWLYYKGMPLKK
jgi:putative transposase